MDWKCALFMHGCGVRDFVRKGNAAADHAGQQQSTRFVAEQADEFYTNLQLIEDELKHYRHHFKDKRVLCNCDDPYESNFFKYFAMNFNALGLKSLTVTCYAYSCVAGKEIDLFTPMTKTPHKIVITEVGDMNGDGRIDLADVEMLWGLVREWVGGGWIATPKSWLRGRLGGRRASG